MSLKEKIQDDVKNAMRGGEKDRVRILRMVTAAIKQKEVDERIDLDEAQVLAVLDKMLKQRRDSLSQYQEANREDLAKVEEEEIAIIATYMPQALSEAEVDTLISEAIDGMGATGMQDMGKVMGVIKPQAQGRADMGQISQKIKAKLAS